MKAAVVGLGKIGLPLAAQIASRGVEVVGLDISAATVATVNGGASPFPGEPGLEERLRAGIAAGFVRATTDAEEAVATADVVVVVVPLVVDADKRPAFAALDAATGSIAPHLRPGTLVSYETTLPVGTTRTRFAPALGPGILVAFSPERVSSGRVFADLARYPKLVGGVDDQSEARAVAFYEAVLTFDDRPDLPRPNGVWGMGSAEAAELAKLAETTYRDVNIAYANELATAARRLEIDVLEVIAACNSQPFSHIHQPGISVGGHCIPVYPHLLMASIDGFQVPATARGVNAGVPAMAVADLAAAAGGLSDKLVVVLGLAYRGGVKEDAFSGTVPLVEAIQRAGGRPVVHDPLYSDVELQARGFEPHQLGQPVDAAILHTDHAEYRGLAAEDLPGVAVVYDGRRWLDPERWPGVALLRIGDGTSGVRGAIDR